MTTVVLVVVLAAIAAGIATVLRRRLPVAAPTRSGYSVPAQLDRGDFDRPEAPWLVAVFSSATCLSCRGTAEKARAMVSDAVVVQEVEAVADKVLHDRYRVDAVPMVAVADAAGVVRASFLGEPSATDLWAAVAELREPGSIPPSCRHGGASSTDTPT